MSRERTHEVVLRRIEEDLAAGRITLGQRLPAERQLAEQLGVSVRTIIRWCDYGDGPPVTAIGRKRLFYRPAVAAWLAKHQRAAA